jgi:hypothetical protein
VRLRLRKLKARILTRFYKTRIGKRFAIRRYRKQHNSLDWPFEYTGPNIARWYLDKGQPLRRVPGNKVAPGAGVYQTPDGVERTLHKSQVERRTD